MENHYFFFNLDAGLAISNYGNLYVLPNRQIDNPKKLNELKGSGWIRGPRDPKSSEISNHIYPRIQYKSRIDIKNISESIHLVVLDHVRFYLLINR